MLRFSSLFAATLGLRFLVSTPSSCTEISCCTETLTSLTEVLLTSRWYLFGDAHDTDWLQDGNVKSQFFVWWVFLKHPVWG